jgi:hypothetical protein
MHAADNAANRARQAVLCERSRVESRRSQHVRVESPAEETAFIREWLRAEQQGADDSRNRAYLHNAQS